MTIYTIGHSNRSLSQLIDSLKAYKVEQLVDIRSIPRSRHLPHFNQDQLLLSLPAAGVDYQHWPKLGGLRHSRPDSTNQAWRNKSFRGYADYMQTSDFNSAIDQLVALAATKTAAIMCAEILPWRCHRSLVGDALLARQVEVIDIFDSHKSRPQTITKFAQILGQTVSYPAEN